VISLSYASPSTPKQVIPSDHLSSTSAGDTTAPTVSNVSPADGATGAGISGNVTATFSEEMDAATLNASSFTLVKQGTTTPVPATVTYDGTTRSAVLNPDADLEFGTTYTATILGGAGGAKDFAGNPLAADMVWSFTTSAVLSGLTGEYYDNADLTNLKGTRVDPTVNFNWGSGSPDPSINAESFSVRWTGQVRADASETYTFYTTSNDGVRLWVNNQLVIDNWTSHAATENKGTIALQAGQ